MSIHVFYVVERENSDTGRIRSNEVGCLFIPPPREWLSKKTHPNWMDIYTSPYNQPYRSYTNSEKQPKKQPLTVSHIRVAHPHQKTQQHSFQRCAYVLCKWDQRNIDEAGKEDSVADLTHKYSQKFSRLPTTTTVEWVSERTFCKGKGPRGCCMMVTHWNMCRDVPHAFFVWRFFMFAQEILIWCLCAALSRVLAGQYLFHPRDLARETRSRNKIVGIYIFFCDIDYL